MIEQDRVTAAAATREDEDFARSVRPRRLDEYIGQSAVKQQMSIFIEAARRRNEALDHVLIFGPTPETLIKLRNSRRSSSVLKAYST